MSTTAIQINEELGSAAEHSFPVTPVWFYYLRLLPQGVALTTICAIILLLGVVVITGQSKSFSPVLLCALLLTSAPFSLIPTIFVWLHRPRLIIQGHGVKAAVPDFFRNRWVKFIYSDRGYGFRWLDMVIDFVEPVSLRYAAIREFKLKRELFVHKVYAVNKAGFEYLLCVRTSKSSAMAVYAELNARKVQLEAKPESI